MIQLARTCPFRCRTQPKTSLVKYQFAPPDGFNSSGKARILLSNLDEKHDRDIWSRQWRVHRYLAGVISNSHDIDAGEAKQAIKSGANLQSRTLVVQIDNLMSADMAQVLVCGPSTTPVLDEFVLTAPGDKISRKSVKVRVDLLGGGWRGFARAG